MNSFNMYRYVKQLDAIADKIRDAIDIGSDTGLLTAAEQANAQKRLTLCQHLTDAALHRRVAFLPDITRFIRQYA